MREAPKIWTISQICVSSLGRGHANLLCILPILVYVLPKWAQGRVASLSGNLTPGLLHDRQDTHHYSNEDSKVAQSCLTLCNPMDYRVHGILQARILEWVAFPFSSGSSPPRNSTGISCIAGGFFTNWAVREASITTTLSQVTIIFLLQDFLFFLQSFFWPSLLHITSKMMLLKHTNLIISVLVRETSGFPFLLRWKLDILNVAFQAKHDVDFAWS